jgi:hypothetical protein
MSPVEAHYSCVGCRPNKTTPVLYGCFDEVGGKHIAQVVAYCLHIGLLCLKKARIRDKITKQSK